MLNGIHGHQDIERVVYGKPAGAVLRAEAERLGAKRVFVMTTKSVAQSALLADVIRELGDRYAGVYAGITAHSPRPCVIEGAGLARDAKADLIIGTGNSIANAKDALTRCNRASAIALRTGRRPQNAADERKYPSRSTGSAIRSARQVTTLARARPGA